MQNKNRLIVSALIPAYNEERNINQVLLLLKKSSLIDEVICINDGSGDKTLQIVKKIPEIKIINLKKNCGKANAIVEGLKAAKGEIVIFIDADVTGLKEDSLKKLISPLQKQTADAVIGYPIISRMDKFFKPLSGERAYFRKDLLPHLSSLKNKRWGLELHLNFLFRGKRLKIVPLQIKNTMKYKKYSYNLAAKTFFTESFDILSVMLKQKRPINYLKDSYIYPFYEKKWVVRYFFKLYDRFL